MVRALIWISGSSFFAAAYSAPARAGSLRASASTGQVVVSVRQLDDLPVRRERFVIAALHSQRHGDVGAIGGPRRVGGGGLRKAILGGLVIALEHAAHAQVVEEDRVIGRDLQAGGSGPNSLLNVVVLMRRSTIS